MPEGAIDWASFVNSVTFVIDVDGVSDAGACSAAGGSADDVDESAAEPAGRGATTQLDLPDSAAPLIAVAQNSWFQTPGNRKPIPWLVLVMMLSAALDLLPSLMFRVQIR